MKWIDVRHRLNAVYVYVYVPVPVPVHCIAIPIPYDNTDKMLAELEARKVYTLNANECE